MKTITSFDNESKFFADVSSILREGRDCVKTAVNRAMVETYWKIGRRIVEQEQGGKERANYGEFIIEGLSRHLGDTFGKGFSVANLKNMRMFYLAFRDAGKSYTLCSQLSWSHLRLIMRLDSKDARDYYLSEAGAQNWTVRALERNIKTGVYDRLLSTQKNKTANTSEAKASAAGEVDASELIRDPYVLEFLGLPESVAGKESQLETAIIAHLQDFLLEMGRGFSFIGRQFRISTETAHFYIDLVFYNYLLKCFVVIDLKTQKLVHQDIGQMDMYVRMFDALKRGADDNPTIGIILCADKDETVVKYSVLQESRQIFASKYKTILPTEAELASEIGRNATMLRERSAIYGVKGIAPLPSPPHSLRRGYNASH